MNIKKIYMDDDEAFYNKWHHHSKYSLQHISNPDNGTVLFKHRIKYKYNFLTTVWDYNEYNKYIYGSKRHEKG